jgi:hypothetical protein
MNCIARFNTTAVLLLAVAATPVSAAGPEVSARGPMSFDGMDSDGNGYVDPEEFRHAHRERSEQREGEQSRYLYRNRDEAPKYADIDTDLDGRVSRGEFQAHRLQRRQQREERRLEHIKRHQEFLERQQRPVQPPAGGMTRGGGKR